MAARSPNPDTGTPRWVKVSGVAVFVLVLVVAILMLSGHGPGQHFGNTTPLSGVAEGAPRDHAPPKGGHP